MGSTRTFRLLRATSNGSNNNLAQWSAGTRREFSRKLSRRCDDNGNPIEAVHLRRVMGLFGILIGKLQLTGPPVLSFRTMHIRPSDIALELHANRFFSKGYMNASTYTEILS